MATNSCIIKALIVNDYDAIVILNKGDVNVDRKYTCLNYHLLLIIE